MKRIKKENLNKGKKEPKYLNSKVLNKLNKKRNLPISFIGK